MFIIQVHLYQLVLTLFRKTNLSTGTDSLLEWWYESQKQEKSAQVMTKGFRYHLVPFCLWIPSHLIWWVLSRPNMSPVDFTHTLSIWCFNHFVSPLARSYSACMTSVMFKHAHVLAKRHDHNICETRYIWNRDTSKMLSVQVYVQNSYIIDYGQAM